MYRSGGCCINVDVCTDMLCSGLKQLFSCTGDEYEKSGRIVECKTYSALMSQIWSLLPGFCTRPTDLADVSRHTIFYCHLSYLLCACLFRI